MSDKFFFKGRKTPKPKHESFGYNTKRSAKPGTLERPFELTVTSSERQAEIAALLQSQKLHGNITVDASAVENIAELDGYLNRPTTATVAKVPGRNDPCSCGSGQKFKRCCG
ncbi:zinc chelation protein SecC [Shewanella sp. Scap07]|uniref:PBPRA1643 family SWIM/SEC-C metal-binding motif protein n=1 Tax=Shewanella sp. Scap07 TaxID=2589987 RepID=UPI0015BB0DDA|nr:PBPRA1643 family SWIM/SEC-C metal-binding motif protein [Shewanella sp. Scap07]QLE84776.1 zinc chelation protein SecC [Shewanella sp. Scap07]